MTKSLIMWQECGYSSVDDLFLDSMSILMKEITKKHDNWPNDQSHGAEVTHEAGRLADVFTDEVEEL